MSRTKFRFALLLCDTPIPAVRDRYGDYHTIFTAFLRASLPEDKRADIDFEMDGYDVVKEMQYPTEDKFDNGYYDGVLITGSAASAYEKLEWVSKLVDYVAWLGKEKPSVKIIGICFGHQIVARSFGMTCVPNNGIWEVGVTSVPLNEVGKEVFGVDTLNIEQMHRDHVPLASSTAGGVVPPFKLLGSTDICPNQGMVSYRSDTSSPTSHSSNLEDIHILTLQGHPEFLPAIVSHIVAARKANGAMSAEVAEDWEKREESRKERGIGNQGVSVVGRAIWKVFGM